MELFVWTLIGFLSGSIPYSLILGRFAKKTDIRRYGDHNPGAANVIRAAGWGWGITAVLLDGFKAAIPVGIAWFVVGIHGWQIVPVALAPVLGHAFSPWLRFKGGKAVASSFGTWAGLTIFVVPTLLGFLLGLAFYVFKVSGWAVMITMLAIGGFIWFYYGPAFPEYRWVWLGNLALLAYTHRGDLKQSPGIRPEILRLFGRGG